jgi:Ca2+-transporting ATPase
MSEAPTGLTSEQAARRRVADGRNELPQDAPRLLLRVVAEVMREPMFALLAAAAVIYAVVGEAAEAAVLCAFATVSVLITVLQQGRSQHVLDALRDRSSPRALVLRDGQLVRIAGREVVRGDLLLLAEGDRIAADATLLSSSALETDESLLSGESLPVAKDSSARVDGAVVYSGSLVVKGRGAARVTATGARSQMGQIGGALRTTPLAVPSLQREVGALVLFMGYAGLGVSLLVLLERGIRRFRSPSASR